MEQSELSPDGVDKGARPRRIEAVVSATLTLAVAGGVDWLTGPNLSVLFIYVIVVLISSWHGGFAMGLAFSVLSTGVWLTCELHASTAVGTGLWNALMRLAVFLTVAILVRIATRRTRELDEIRRDTRWM